MLAFWIGRAIGALVFTLLGAALWRRVIKRPDPLLAHLASLASVTLIGAAGNLDGRPWASLPASALEVLPWFAAGQAIWLLLDYGRMRRSK